MAKYEGDLTLGDTEAEKVSGFGLGFDVGRLSYGSGIEQEALNNIHKQYPDYNENFEAYNEWRDLSNEITSQDYTREKYIKAVYDKKYFDLDENNDIVPGEGHFFGADAFYLNRDALKGLLLAKKNGFTADTLDEEYSSLTKSKSEKLAEKREDVSAWTYYPGVLTAHIAQPETLVDFMSPGKVMASTIKGGAVKAFTVEAGVALVGEAMREQRIKEHMERAELEYTLWDSVENILIGAGFAGALRGLGSAVQDSATFRKINEGITNKTDKEIFARYAQRENYKLTKDSTKHLALLEKAREDIDAGRKVDIADHTDIDISTKTDDAVEEINIVDEVKATSNISTEDIKHFEQSIDEVPSIKEPTEADPYEGMTTSKEADELIQEMMDDPEIKALYNEIESDKARLSPQAQMAKEAKEPAIGGSEDDAKEAVKQVFKKKDTDTFKNYSPEDIEELDRLFREDQEIQRVKNEVEDELNADIAGVGGTSVFASFGPELFLGTLNGIDYDDETGTFTFDPLRFAEWFLAGHAAKQLAKNKKLTEPMKKEAMEYFQRIYDKLKDKPAFNYLTGTMRAVDDAGVVKKITKLTDNDIYMIKPNADFKGEITLLKNKEQAPYMGARFGQDVEPSGFYAIQKESNSLDELPNYETVKADIKNPLIIDVTDDLVQWKIDLSEEYKGSKGKRLTNKLVKDGYDAIITTDKDGYTGEIIILDTSIIGKAE